MVTTEIIEENSSLQETAIIEAQLKETIQTFPDVSGNGSGYQSLGYGELFSREALLPPRGTYRRLELERRWYYHEDNEMFRDIVTGLAKRIQSMPYEIKAPEEDGPKWDNFVRYANFNNWETFISQLVVNYSIYDTGAFVEIIAPGHPRKPPVGEATGISILDTRRVTMTGDPLYPVVYTSVYGGMHLLHKTRVIQIVDTEEKNDDLPGWGDSALSRCITTIYRELLASSYMRASLDDKPAPGFAIAKNLTEQHIMQRLAAMENKRENDHDVLGRLVFLYGADTSQVPNLEFQQFQKEFSGFDPEKLSNMNARYMAAGVGVDIQDFWELTGRNIGSATQSEILSQKSKGRALGRLLKTIERVINDVFPTDVEFTFLYRNEEEDLNQAQTAQTWVAAIESMTTVTPDERRIMLANQVPAVKDAITDNNGQVIRWDDSDPKTEEQASDTDVLEPAEPKGSEQVEEAPDDNLATPEEKDFRRTRRSFIDTFNLAIKWLKEGTIGSGAAVVLIMDELRTGGRETLLDGVKRSGKRNPAFTDEMERELAAWSARQQSFVRSFVRNVDAGEFSDKQLRSKGMVWANSSLEELLYKGMAMNKPKALWKWLINFAKENCASCLKLHGQIHMLKTYIDSGLVPKSPRLLCTGKFCGCRLQKVPKGTKAAGKISAVKKKSYRIKLRGMSYAYVQ